ncbi:hypothetical protein PGB90_008226 [Kerria lacca]
MEDDLELQLEEEEALLAIYDGDSAFNRISSTVFQYRCGENGENNSILLEISWPPLYPNEKPNINLNTFYNKHLGPFEKKFISDKINEKAQQYLGVAMTYTLIELVKDNLNSWFTEVYQQRPIKSFPEIEEILPDVISQMHVSESIKKEPKKEQLSKAQKRRLWNRCDIRGEQPRGWNWVDIVKHLSQTGSQNENNVSSNS